MVVLQEMPDDATIRAFRGLVDFYCWKGIPVARAWPRRKNWTFNAAQEASQGNFAVASVARRAVSPVVMLAWQALADYGSGYAWGDAFLSAALGKPWEAADDGD